MEKLLKKFIRRFFVKLYEGYLFQKKCDFIGKFSSIGKNFFFQEPSTITSPENISIGDNVSIASFVHIWGEGGVEIGNNVMIASHCAITSVTHESCTAIFNSSNIYKKVTIGNNVWIGTHSIILPGVTIGDNVIIGAGSFVNKDVVGNGLYFGVPVKKIKDLEQFQQ